MNVKNLRHIKGARVYALGVLLALISLSHYLAGGVHSIILHGLIGHLYIIPIVLSAYWYGIRGGISISIISVLLYLPHLFLHWHNPFQQIYNYAELFLFLLIGAVTGMLSQMERNQRMRYEEALQRLDESHRKLKEQMELLFQIEEQLRRADRLSALGELSAGMAHEIRNPLGAIKGAVEILKDDYSPDDTKYEFIQLLLKETVRLDNIVQEFLGFARPKQPEYCRANINEIIESVLSLTAQEVRKRGIKVWKQLNPSIRMQSCDAAMIKQAFLNLVLNAVQAMPTGGDLTVESTVRNDMVEMRVTDTGSGISEENKKKLFTPFFTTKKQGIGLGLVITYRIIEKHQGRIDVISEPGKGATFTVKIPVDKG